MKVKSESEVAQLCPTLSDPVDCSLPGSSVHEILQARILEWVALSSPGNLPDPGIEPGSPALEADALTSEPPEVEVAESGWTLCNPMNCSPPLSSVHGILQARTVE